MPVDLPFEYSGKHEKNYNLYVNGVSSRMVKASESNQICFMTRFTGIDFAEALYQLTFRGDRSEVICATDADRERLPGIRAEVTEHHHWRCRAF